MFQTLIVEDNANFRHSPSELPSERFPCMVIEEASNGSEALDKFTWLALQLVVRDIKRPDSNGLDLTHQIRSANLTAAVVVLTAYDILEYSEAAFQAGANCFVCKATSNGAQIASRVDSAFSGRLQPVAAGRSH